MFIYIDKNGICVDYYKHKKMTIYGHIRKGRLNTHFIKKRGGSQCQTN